MSARLGEPVADSDSVKRYGPERAAEFARLRQAQTTLMVAFDSLSENAKTVHDAANAAWTFDYLWSLLDARRAETLVDPAEAGDSE